LNANKTILASLATFVTAIGTLADENTILEMHSVKASNCPADSKVSL